LRELCTKAKEGTNRRLYQNAKWESQKEYVREKLSDKKTGEIYRKRKIDVEPFFGFLKANLGFTRLSLRGQSKAHNELGFALLAVNLRKFTANNVKTPMNPNDDKNKNGSIYDKTVNRTIFLLSKTSYVPASFIFHNLLVFFALLFIYKIANNHINRFIFHLEIL